MFQHRARMRHSNSKHNLSLMGAVKYGLGTNLLEAAPICTACNTEGWVSLGSQGAID